MQALAHLSRGASRLCSGAIVTHAARPAAFAQPTFAAAAAAIMPTGARANSTLPVLDEYVRRSYPFPTILESDIPPDYSKWLYYHHQFPHDLPLYKSKLTVDIRDLGLDPTSRMVLREIVQGRYSRRTHTISFVSRNLPTAQANENRVFQQLDACLIEARTIAEQINKDGKFGRESGARHNRLLHPAPSETVLKNELLAERRRKVNEIRVLAGKAPLPKTTPKGPAKPKAAAAAADATPAAATDAAAVTPAAAGAPKAKKAKKSRALKNALALGMTKEEKTAMLATLPHRAPLVVQ